MTEETQLTDDAWSQMKEARARKAYQAILQDVKNPRLDGYNPHFDSKFSTLKAIMESIRKACFEHQAAYSQTIAMGMRPYLESRLLVEESDGMGLSRMPLDLPSDPQKIGSYLTYMRRYVALTDFGIVGDPDDDGNAASEKPKRATPKKGATKRDVFLARVEELMAEATSAGVRGEGLEEYAQARYGRPYSELSPEELVEFGQHVKQVIEDKRALSDGSA